MRREPSPCFLTRSAATAQVSIVEDLGGEDLILWLPTAFLLAQASFTLFFGQVLQSFSSKS